MNKIQDNVNNKTSIPSQKESAINNNKNEIKDNNIVVSNKKINTNMEQIRKEIEEKVDFYMMKGYDELFSSYNEKLNDLLMIQEKVFIKNEMIKQQIFYLENYLKNLSKKNKKDDESISY